MIFSAATWVSSAIIRSVGQVIDEESHRFLEEALARATSILSDQRGLLDRVSRELIGQETLEAQALEAISDGMILIPGRWT